MALLTPLLKLIKPEKHENYDVDVWNKNSDAIDDAVGKRVIKNEDIAPGTATKVHYDKKGLITGAEELTPDDIPNLDISKIENRAPVLYIDGVPIYGSRFVDVDESGNIILNTDGSGDWLISITEDGDVLVTKVVIPVIDNLTSDDSDKSLSANMGKFLKNLIDTLTTAFDTHKGDKNNPHSITKAQVGLGNVDNTTDANKPVSTATATELAKKVDKTTYATDKGVTDSHISNTSNPHGVTKSQVGLGNVDNTADANKQVLSATKLKTARKINGVDFDGTKAITIADDTKIPLTEKGAAGGVATLDDTGKIPSTFLPSYVDDVIEGTLATFPNPGETGKIYVDTSTEKTYRWSGTQYTVISETVSLGETASTAYPGNKGKQNATNIAALQTTVQQQGNAIDDLETDAQNKDQAIQQAQTDIQQLQQGKADLQDGKVPNSQLPYFNTAPTVYVDDTPLYAVTFASVVDGIITVDAEGDYIVACDTDGNVFVRPVTNKITDPVTGYVYRLDIVDSQPILTLI